ncbi:MAG: CotH kinase family protein [Roseburia sp.]|nr:CotH kinase family protein [Roseburia sp.]
MSTHKYVDKIIAGIMALAVLATGMITYLVQAKPEAVEAFAYTAQCSYEKLFDQYAVMEVDIAISEENWADILANPLAEEYKECDVTINGETYANVAIRTKGNTSLSQVASSESDRYSFKIEFDHYDSGQTLEGLDKLVLNNIFCDATYLKEYIAYDMFRYLGVAVPYYTFAHITVNGEEWGLYLALEAMEESFVERVYRTDAGQLYKPESTGMGGMRNQGGRSDIGELPDMGEQPENGGRPEQGALSSEALSDMETLPDRGGFPGQGGIHGADRDMSQGMGHDTNRGMGHGMDASSGGSDLAYTDDSTDSYSDIFDNAAFDPSETDKARVVEALKNLSEGENLEESFDVDACLRYFAAQTFIVNMDSYYSNLKHNYYLYEQDGQVTILPWDLNLAFGGFQASDATDAVNSAIDTPMGGEMESSRPMFSKLMEVSEYQELYHRYLRELVEGYVGSGQFQKTLSAIRAVIDGYVQKDATAFYSYEEYQEAVENLKLFVLLRAESVEGQLNGSIPSVTSAQQSSDALIDASEVSLSAMGVQGGDGAGGKGSENGRMFGDRFGERGGYDKR